VTVRLRLTLLYSALFLLAGAVLLGVTYGLVANNLPDDRIVVRSFEQPALPPEAGVEGPGIIVNGVPADPSFLEALPVRVRDEALDELVVQGLAALGVLGVMSVGLGWVVAGRVLAPLHSITATARRLSEENLDERIAMSGPNDELKELSDTFDGMLARLDAAFDSQRRFAANASHELRTPLTIIRTELDVALADPASTTDDLRAVADRVRTATMRAENLIEGLLTLARSERGLPSRERVDLADVARVAIASVSVQSQLDSAPVDGDPALLERLAANVVDNAVTHNVPDGGWVHVQTYVADGHAVLRVANSGPVVPADEVDALFEPFHRRGDPRTAGRGAGLGLSIVRAVARAHGGGVTARPFAGGGLEVVVSLPARQSF
jgi:hypothetical protein